VRYLLRPPIPAVDEPECHDVDTDRVVAPDTRALPRLGGGRPRPRGRRDMLSFRPYMRPCARGAE
jgi:hypothetical protein